MTNLQFMRSIFSNDFEWICPAVARPTSEIFYCLNWRRDTQREWRRDQWWILREYIYTYSSVSLHFEKSRRSSQWTWARICSTNSVIRSKASMWLLLNQMRKILKKWLQLKVSVIKWIWRFIVPLWLREADHGPWLCITHLSIVIFRSLASLSASRLISE